MSEEFPPTLLVTGGTGFIGSHTVLACLESWKGMIIVIDNLENSWKDVANVLETYPNVIFEQEDLSDAKAVNVIFDSFRPAAVIHFAALKSVGDSISNPIRYYQQNVGMLLNVLKSMETYGTQNLIFSSSATVYGDARHDGDAKHCGDSRHDDVDTDHKADYSPVPLRETDYDLVSGQGLGRSVHCPYAHSKRMCEQILHDVSKQHPEWSITVLRYFNPVGADPLGRIGEWSRQEAKNVVPVLFDVISGRRATFEIYGNDYPTQDGTCERDYVHVMDIAEGHACALQHARPGLITCNLGRGISTSVLELVRTVEEVTGQTVPTKLAKRRPGDLPAVFAEVTRAKILWNWTASRSLTEMIQDSMAWNRNLQLLETGRDQLEKV